jgi:c(7)-type cytochrome triheme protein
VKKRIGATLLLTAVALLSCQGGGLAMDRTELGNVIKAIPPNGPLWKYGTLIMRRRTKKAGMAPVVFAHWSHRARYTCRVCHLDLGFSMRAGDTGITRAQYTAGKYCGACHDEVTAFGVQGGEPSQCARCHMKDTRALEFSFETFAATLPMSGFGNGIDWALALKSGRISPKNTLSVAAPPMPLPEKLRLPMKLGTPAPRSDVTFSHEDHFRELDCSSCHPDIFNIKKKGTVDFSMDRNIFGDYCGVCHMRVAFPMNDCKRCHPSMSGFSGF